MDVIISGILFDHLRDEEEQLAKLEDDMQKERELFCRRIAKLEEKAQPIRERVAALRAVFEEDDNE